MWNFIILNPFFTVTSFIPWKHAITNNRFSVHRIFASSPLLLMVVARMRINTLTYFNSTFWVPPFFFFSLFSFSFLKTKQSWSWRVPWKEGVEATTNYFIKLFLPLYEPSLVLDRNLDTDASCSLPIQRQ